MDLINRDTYENISQEFSETRAYVWKCVKDFASLVKPNTKIIEVGCGNGKNMEYLKIHTSCEIVGVDTCRNFVQICADKNLEAQLANSTDLPFKDNEFDHLLCIAMFHHLLTDEDRDKSMGEFIRVLKPDATGIITCWSTEQPPSSKFQFTEGINIVPWRGRKNIRKDRYYYVYTEEMFRNYFVKFHEIEILQIYNEAGNWILVFRKNSHI